jgi:Tol biopolymer transport system component
VQRRAGFVLGGSPARSPDGRTIACGCERSGNVDIYVMNADVSGRRRLTRNPWVDADPTWSPDGSRIVFERKHKESSEDSFPGWLQPS